MTQKNAGKVSIPPENVNWNNFRKFVYSDDTFSRVSNEFNFFFHFTLFDGQIEHYMNILGLFIPSFVPKLLKTIYYLNSITKFIWEQSCENNLLNYCLYFRQRKSINKNTNRTIIVHFIRSSRLRNFFQRINRTCFAEISIFVY